MRHKTAFFSLILTAGLSTSILATEAEQVQNLYESLINGYRVPQTGLFLSFPHTPDNRLVQQAAIYDQGVIGLLLLKTGDIEKVAPILTFFENVWEQNQTRSGDRLNVDGFANFYNAYFGCEGIEKTIHAGPNAWIGLLASRYFRKTGDTKSRDLALSIAHWMMEKIPHKDGAIAMGPIRSNYTPWNDIYSTENNLSVYAFLSDLLKATTLDEKERSQIQQEHASIEGWLLQKAYSSDTHKVIRGVIPGGLDLTGAVDSYTWFIAALLPDYLKSKGVSVDLLARRAETDFVVTVGSRTGVDIADAAMATLTYEDDVQKRPEDPQFMRPAVDGHRLIWYEGTGQFVVMLKDMAAYHTRRAHETPAGPRRTALLRQASDERQKASAFSKEMDQALIKTRWGTGYPAATTGRFYKYGWASPAPVDGHMIDASAPLAWRLFAAMGYEPMSDTLLDPSVAYVLQPIRGPSLRNPGTPVLYGASEEMTSRAWVLYESGDQESAERQANATITLWERDAIKLEKLKEEKAGTYLPYDGTQEGAQAIHEYWALNDVAACYLILANIEDKRRHYDNARWHMTTILKRFYLAQVWDKRGWFWNPVDSVTRDFIRAKAYHYGDLAGELPSITTLTASQQLDFEAHHRSELQQQGASRVGKTPD